MIAAFLILLEWASAGLAVLAALSAVQLWALAPAIVGAAAAAIAALARMIALRRASGLYRDADLRAVFARGTGRPVNDDRGRR